MSLCNGTSTTVFVTAKHCRTSKLVLCSDLLFQRKRASQGKGFSPGWYKGTFLRSVGILYAKRWGGAEAEPRSWSNDSCTGRPPSPAIKVPTKAELMEKQAIQMHALGNKDGMRTLKNNFK